jgi:hypothetical protein
MRTIDARPGAPPDWQVLEFMRLLWAVSHGCRRRRSMARRLGLTGPQRLGCVSRALLASRPGNWRICCAFTPARSPGSAASGTSGADRAAGGRDDRRRSHLFLTVKGARANQPASGTVEHAVKAVLARLGERRVSVAAQVLEALAEQLMRPGEHGGRDG